MDAFAVIVRYDNNVNNLYSLLYKFIFPSSWVDLIKTPQSAATQSTILIESHERETRALYIIIYISRAAEESMLIIHNSHPKFSTTSV